MTLSCCCLSSSLNNSSNLSSNLFLQLVHVCQWESWTGYCASHSCWQVVKARTTGQSKDYWSKQGLLVKARTTGQSKDYWSKQGLLVKARNMRQILLYRATCQWLLVHVMASCPRQGYLSMVTRPGHGYFVRLAQGRGIAIRRR